MSSATKGPFDLPSVRLNCIGNSKLSKIEFSVSLAAAISSFEAGCLESTSSAAAAQIATYWAKTFELAWAGAVSTG